MTASSQPARLARRALILAGRPRCRIRPARISSGAVAAMVALGNADVLPGAGSIGHWFQAALILFGLLFIAGIVVWMAVSPLQRLPFEGDDD